MVVLFIIPPFDLSLKCLIIKNQTLSFDIISKKKPQGLYLDENVRKTTFRFERTSITRWVLSFTMIPSKKNHLMMKFDPCG